MLLVDTLRALRERIDRLDAEIAARAKHDEGAQRLMSIPGIGPMIATAIQALAPPAGTFRSGRDFAAWVGLTPVQKSTGGKTRLGRTSRMGERTLRRLLIIGASGVVRWAKRKGVPPGSWLGWNARAQAAHAGDRGAGQQDRPRRVGADHQGREIPSSDRRRLKRRRSRGCRRRRRAKDRYGATSVRRDRKNQAHGQRFERVPMMWI